MKHELIGIVVDAKSKNDAHNKVRERLDNERNSRVIGEYFEYEIKEEDTIEFLNDVERANIIDDFRDEGLRTAALTDNTYGGYIVFVDKMYC